MISSSHDYKKAEAFTAEFNIPVSKDKESKLAYNNFLDWKPHIYDVEFIHKVS